MSIKAAGFREDVQKVEDTMIWLQYELKENNKHSER